MSRNLYFVCATPGSSGNFISRLINTVCQGTEILDFNSISYTQPLSGQLTKDFFFENCIIPDGDRVVSVPFTPDYQKLNSRFPECKIVVLTHRLEDCNHIARAYYQSFFVEAYEISSSQFFAKILQDHSHLFGDTNATPSELTETEKATFIKILTYQKLLDGFFCVNIPQDSNVLKIEFKNLFLNPSIVQAQIENFTGLTFGPVEQTLLNDLTSHYIQRYFSLNKKLV